jgi:hypothetical protein
VALESGDVSEAARIIQALRADLPAIYQAMLNNGQTAQVYEDTLSAALLNGYATAAVTRAADPAAASAAQPGGLPS